MPSQHINCRRVWNLIQARDVQSRDYKVYISTPPSPKVENFQMKIYYPAGDQTPDLLNQRQTCYHLSQHGELVPSIWLPPYFSLSAKCLEGIIHHRLSIFVDVWY